MKLSRTFFLLLVIFAAACKPEDAERLPGLMADSAMVVCAHPIAAQVGVDILRKGGNAIDAAVAVQFALCVVFPEAGNIGGGGFLLMRKSNGETTALDFREKAPAKAFREMYLDSAGNVIPLLSERGNLASGIPGSVAGMIEMHSKHGMLPWAELVQPAVDLALKGVVLTKRAADDLNDIQNDLKTYNSVSPDFLLKTWSPGDTIRWIDLGHTLERIRDQGLAGFYEGKTADDLVAEMKRTNGLITHDDLKNYKPEWATPITGTFKDFKIISMPLPSSGGIALLQMLSAVEPYPLKDWGHNSAKSVHILTEAMRRTFADRSVYLGDPKFFKVPVEQLISKEYIKERMNTYNPEKATPSAEVKEGKITGFEPTETTHISIVDPQGNAVAVTTTLNDWFGSRVVVPGSGFFLNNEMDDFSAKPGVPNAYGVTGGLGNSIQPRKTMLSSMTPTIIEKNNKLYMVVGSPGGPRIITAVYQVTLNVLAFGMGMQEAVDAARIHSQWLPDAIYTEPNALPKADSIRLVEMGHTFKSDIERIGRVDAILVLPNGKYEAGADRKRGDDAAAGY